jgi:hypothetical protein
VTATARRPLHDVAVIPVPVIHLLPHPASRRCAPLITHWRRPPPSTPVEVILTYLDSPLPLIHPTVYLDSPFTRRRLGKSAVCRTSSVLHAHLSSPSPRPSVEHVAAADPRLLATSTPLGDVHQLGTTARHHRCGAAGRLDRVSTAQRSSPRRLARTVSTVTSARDDDIVNRHHERLPYGGPSLAWGCSRI